MAWCPICEGCYWGGGPWCCIRLGPDAGDRSGAAKRLKVELREYLGRVGAVHHRNHPVIDKAAQHGPVVVHTCPIFNTLAAMVDRGGFERKAAVAHHFADFAIFGQGAIKIGHVSILQRSENERNRQRHKRRKAGSYEGIFVAHGVGSSVVAAWCPRFGKIKIDALCYYVKRLAVLNRN